MRSFNPHQLGTIVGNEPIQQQFNPHNYGSIVNNQQQMPQWQINQNEMFNPANQTDSGSMVPPGTYNTPAAKAAATLLSGALTGTIGIPEAVAAKLWSPVSGAISSTMRVGGMSGLGGLENIGQGKGSIGQQFEEGALHSIPLSIAGESLSIPFRAAKYIAEKIHPEEYTNKMAEAIRSTYNKYSNQAKDIFTGLKDSHGQSNIYDIQNNLPNMHYFKTPQETFNSYPNTIKKLHTEFTNNPTYKNAQDLQKQMGSYIGKLREGGNTDPSTLNAISDTKEARDYIIQDITDFFDSVGGKTKEKYNEGRAIIRDITSPHENNPVINKIAKGLKTEVDPHELASNLQKLQESGELPKNHYLREELKALQEKIHTGQLYQYGIPIAASIAGGELMHPGIATALGGLGAGGYLGHVASPYIAKVAQNPELVKLVKALSAPYYAGMQALIGYNNKHQ